jgi:hypothetical protein
MKMEMSIGPSSPLAFRADVGNLLLCGCQAPKPLACACAMRVLAAVSCRFKIGIGSIPGSQLQLCYSRRLLSIGPKIFLFSNAVGTRGQSAIIVAEKRAWTTHQLAARAFVPSPFVRVAPLLGVH